eukprot:scaffold237874_cov21-Prasinocladus_malaysianus.AAC.1
MVTIDTSRVKGLTEAGPHMPWWLWTAQPGRSTWRPPALVVVIQYYWTLKGRRFQRVADGLVTSRK